MVKTMAEILKPVKRDIYETATAYNYLDDTALSYEEFQIFQLATANFNKDKKRKYYFNQQQHQNVVDEITFVLRGEGTVTNNSLVQPLMQGQLHIVFQGQQHKISSLSSAPLKFYSLAFKIRENSPLFPLYKEVKKYCLKSNKFITVDTNNIVAPFESLLIKVASYAGKNIEYFNLSIESSVKYILTMAFLDFLPEKSDKSELLIEQFKTFLLLNYSNPSALTLLAQNFNYSYTYLSHLFKKETGQTLVDYFKTLRMNYANNLLHEGSSVSDISNQLGYSSLHAFSRAYKAHFGVPPSTTKGNNRIK